MKKILLILILFAVGSFGLSAQNVSITGKIANQDKTVYYPNVKVNVTGTQFNTLSDSEGKFILSDIPAGNYVLEFILTDFMTFEFPVNAEKDTDIGTIVMKRANGAQVAIIEISEDEIEDDESGSDQNVSGILHGSRDAFLSVAGYNLGQLRFRVRGYDSKYTPVYMNGIPVQDLESDRISWSQWGGLNDAIWNRSATRGLDFSDNTFGNIGGSQTINTRASEYRPGTKLTYSSTNRSYRNRAMLTHSTGLMDNGFALTLSGSRRWSEEGYVEGTFYDAWGYFMALEKKFSDKHSLNLTAFGAPTKRGQQGGSTQEVYDLTGNNFYNPNWGWQDGEKRNARVVDTHKPMIILTDYLNLNKTTRIQTSLAASFGKYGSSALNWYNAADPRPDYYRYLPSYETNPDAIAAIVERFQKGEAQLDWNSFYQTNYNNYQEIQNADGIAGNVASGLQSEFIIEERRSDEMQFFLNSTINKEINDFLSIDAGVDVRHYTMNHYTKVLDLLGGEFIVDNDKYAERDFAEDTVAYNDIRFPNRIVREGDRFGYDYDANVRYEEVWAQANFVFSKIDFSIGANGAYNTFWRTGNMQNGKFPNNSLGDSEKVNFIDYGAKAQAIYKISGKHYIRGHAAYMTKAPNFQDAYISPRTRDQLVTNLQSETIYSGDIGYVMRAPKLKMTFDAYYTKFNDQSWVRSFYHDGHKAFVNYAMSGIDKIHQGVELGVEANLTSTLSLTAAGALGYYYWDSRPLVNVSVDNSSEIIVENETVFAQGFLESGTPQSAGSVGLRYSAPKYWFAGANFNYIQDAFLSFNPVRRTADAVEGIDRESELYESIVFQEELPAGYTVDIFVGKSWRIKRKYYINLSLNVSNILNNQDIITGGYEQLRFDDIDKNPEKYDSKYYYNYGINYFLNLSFRY